MRILLLEDHKLLADSIAEVLSEYEVEKCFRLQQAYQEMQNPFDLYIVDLNLPDGNGMEFLSYLREFSDAPVLIISNLHDEETILEGYSFLIDDYIEKPFRLAIFKAKVQALLKRKYKEENKLNLGEVLLDGQEAVLNVLSAKKQPFTNRDSYFK